MERRVRVALSLGVLVGALTGDAGCKASPPAPEALVPASASLIAGIHVREILRSPIYANNRHMLENDRDAKAALAAAKDCSFDLASLESLTLGVDAQTQAYVAVLAGSGVGDPKSLECLRTKTKAHTGGVDPWTVRQEAGLMHLDLSDGKTTAVVVHPDRVVVVSRSWLAAVHELAAKKGTPAVEAGLRRPFEAAQTSSHVWFAAVLPAAMRENVALPQAQALETLSGNLDFTDGLALRATAGTSSEAAAQTMRDEVQSQFDGLKGLASMMGVPQGITDGVRFTAEGQSVVIEARASKADLETVQQKFASLLGGAAAGGDTPRRDPAPALPAGLPAPANAAPPTLPTAVTAPGSPTPPAPPAP